MNSTLSIGSLAQKMYEAYGLKADWKTWDGKPMPQWTDIGEIVRGRWMAAAEEAVAILKDTWNVA